MKHKYYDAIVAWASGETIQVREEGSDDEWENFEGEDPSFGSVWEFRVKPKTITKKYRMALVDMYAGIKVKEPSVRTVEVTNSSLNNPVEYNVEGFIRWVGDVTEVEVEV